MIPFDSLLMFTSAAFILALAPGPDNIFVLSHSALYGRISGLFVTLGLCSGILMHTAVVVFGVAAFLQNSPTAFNVLRGVGAIYLLYLSWKTWGAVAMQINGHDAPQFTYASLYSRGILMNVTNPKVALFFLAFLPQFADPSRGSLSFQLVQLGLIFVLITLVVFSAFAWLAATVGHWLKRSAQVQNTMNRAAALVYAGLALRLVWSLS